MNSNDNFAQFAPIVYFHNQELYFPSSIEYFWGSQNHENINYNVKYGFNQPGDLAFTPWYIRKLTTHTFRYTLFFPCKMSWSIWLLYCENSASHIEYVDITIDDKDHIIGVCIGENNIKLESLEWFNGRIVLYSEKNTHNFYSSSPQFAFTCTDPYVIRLNPTIFEYI